MATRFEVEVFLNMFKAKMEVFDVIFLSRDKNLRALIDLEMTRISRREILRELTSDDYFRGPTADTDKGSDLWEFGRLLRQKEVYIKITFGMMNKPVICISFHIAERAIIYPFKK